MADTKTLHLEIGNGPKSVIYFVFFVFFSLYFFGLVKHVLLPPSSYEISNEIWWVGWPGRTTFTILTLPVPFITVFSVAKKVVSFQKFYTYALARACVRMYTYLFRRLQKKKKKKSNKPYYIIRTEQASFLLLCLRLKRERGKNKK